MLGKTLLKQLYHETKQEINKHNKTLDQLIVIVYHYLSDKYGELYNKNDAREIALCLFYNYGFLYK